MNFLTKHFYEKERKIEEKDMDKKGLIVGDNEKFNEYIKGIAKRSLIYSILFLILIIYIIILWVIK